MNRDRIWWKLRASFRTELIASLLLIGGTTACTGQPASHNRNALCNDGSVELGNIDGVNYRIPSCILFTGVYSKKQRTALWTKEFSQEPNSYMREIDLFDIVLGFPSLHPLVDRESRLTAKHSDLLTGDISHGDFVQSPNPVRNLIKAYEASDNPFGIFRPSGHMFGLQRWTSSSLDPRDPTKPNEFLFDDIAAVFVQCTSGKTILAPHTNWGQCTEYFSMPDSRVVIKVSYDRKWLSLWAKVRTDVSSLVHHLVVSKTTEIRGMPQVNIVD